MTSSRWIAFLLLPLFSWTQAAPFQIKIDIFAGDRPYASSTALMTANKEAFILDSLKFYLSRVALIQMDGTEKPLEGLQLIEFSQNSTQKTSTWDVPEGDYKGLRFDIAVPRELNHLDATVQELPLGIESGMFWAWNSGYIFFKLEGKSSLHSIALHIGGDQRSIPVNLADLQKNTTLFTLPKSGLEMAIKLDILKIFSKGVDGEPFQLSNAKYQQVHGGPVADQIDLNLQTAFDYLK